MTWPGAGDPPANNVVGLDPQLVAPEQGDFRPAPGSPAAAYGCQSFRAGGWGATVARAAEPAGAPGPAGKGPGAAGAAIRAARDGRAGHAGHAGRVGGAGRADRFEVSGVIAEDTVWSDTVHVVGETVVADGATLTISPGSQVLFAGHYALAVQGRLLALGGPEERIRFDALDPSGWMPDTSAHASWGGLRFEGTRAANGISRLEWCEVAHAKGVGSRPKGGALSLIDGPVVNARNCHFHDNLAVYGGVLFCERTSGATLAGCLLTDNIALLHGSAVYCLDAWPKLHANTIAYNACVNPEYMDDTGAIHLFLSKAWSIGNIVYANSSNYFLPLQFREGKPFSVRYCDVEGGFDGEGNVDADPLFAGPPEHPYALSEGSPCANAGPPAVAGLGLLALDLAGRPRVLAGRIDMGAYETGDPAAVPSPDGDGTDPGAIVASCGPNPFRRETTIRLRIPASAATAGSDGAVNVRVDVHDATGRRVSGLVEALAPGVRLFRWEARDAAGRPLPPGVYFGRVFADGLPAAPLRLHVIR